ncbi:bL21 family ribosomal protein [Candidatus Berkelbacteria bacterium]|nr:bL21 family ribosomal protein [Candidatus Berkelbacteria bacterium]
MSEKNAVISTGGKQYLVQVGDIISIEKLASKVDGELTFTNELDGKGEVKAKVIEQVRTPKVSGRIFRNKTRSSRIPRGHRQSVTKVKIEAIG